VSFQGLLKTSGNPLATLVFLGEKKTPGKAFSGGLNPRNAKNNPH